MSLGANRNGLLSNYPNQALTHEGDEVGGRCPKLGQYIIVECVWCFVLEVRAHTD
jgi:hypothetical protein